MCVCVCVCVRARECAWKVGWVNKSITLLLNEFWCKSFTV